jgi:hypothetical protein
MQEQLIQMTSKHDRGASVSCGAGSSTNGAVGATSASDDLWPYTAGSCLIDRETARSIRRWALTVMTEAELNAHSQRQILRRYINEYVRPTLVKVAPRVNDPEVQAATIKGLSEIFGYTEATIQQVLAGNDKVLLK